MRWNVDIQRLEEATKKLEIKKSETSNILVVEDDVKTADLIESVIIDEGYNCVKVSNGADALNHISTKTIDLMFLDIVLENEIDGIDILTAIRKMTHKPMIVVVSGVKNECFLKSMMEVYPIVCWATKPLTIENIKAILSMFNLNSNKN